MSRGAVNTVVERLTDRDAVTGVDGLLHATPRGLGMLAAGGGLDARRPVEAVYLGPNGEKAGRERRHGSAVAKVPAKFLGRGSCGARPGGGHPGCGGGGIFSEDRQGHGGGEAPLIPPGPGPA